MFNYKEFLTENKLTTVSQLDENEAKTILKQLGGNKFVAMTGAKQLMDRGKALSFALPRAKGGINFVMITLTGRDDYDIQFARKKGADYKVVKDVNGVGVEQLRNVFEKVTGLRTSL